MTAEEVLAHIMQAGGRVIADPARPRVIVPLALKSLVLAHKAALRALVLQSNEVADPPPQTETREYAFPWPSALTGLGPHAVGPFDICSECSGWSWVRYGHTVLCLTCARHHLREGQSGREG